ncbi:MAG: gliding motility-associated C-terminal domain-containing protein, partial [Bacteroidota bacterium]|nr:gliding motility-associated C-terminal domain-containing protein [Bacteroidota bacterium]
ECKVSAGYANPSYLWQQSLDGGSTWTDIPSETKNTMNKIFTPTTPVGSYMYRLTVGEASNAGLSTCKVSSAVLTVLVKSNPVIHVSSNSPVCQGTEISLLAAGGSAEMQYTWAGANSFIATGSSAVVKNAQLVNAGKYYIQVTSSDGCKYADSTTVVVTAAPVVTTTSNKSICKGDSVLLGSSGGASYLWFPAKGLSSAFIANPVARPSDSIVYTVVVSNSASCKDSATVAINVISKPIAHAGPDKEMVEGQSVQLNGEVEGGNNNYNITWYPSLFINNIHVLEPVVSPLATTSYVLTVDSNNGCGSSSDTASVRVFKKIVVPNAFSPNGDGVNDSWNITALSAYENYELSVFNRFGQRVYNTKDYSQPWNGTFNGEPLPVGTYYYLLDLKLGLPKLNGYVVILR